MIRIMINPKVPTRLHYHYYDYYCCYSNLKLTFFQNLHHLDTIEKFDKVILYRTY